MKKTKILAFVLCAAIMMMGAGYAYWSDALIIDSTVSTGELNVRLTQATLVSNETNGTYLGTQILDRDTNLAPVFTGNVKNLTTTLSNLYPGASATFNLKFENNGTIPAVLHEYSVAFDDTSIAAENRLTDAQKGLFKVISGQLECKVNGVVSTVSLPAGNSFSLVEFAQYVNQQTTNLRLEPQDYVNLKDIVITLDGPNAGDVYENKTVKMNMNMNFQQHNQ